MAYRIACDSCDVEIEAGTGRPGSIARQRVFCERCGKVAAHVEEVIRKKGTKWALEASRDLDKERERLMREMLPGPGEKEGVADLPPILA